MFDEMVEGDALIMACDDLEHKGIEGMCSCPGEGI